MDKKWMLYLVLIISISLNFGCATTTTIELTSRNIVEIKREAKITKQELEKEINSEMNKYIIDDAAKEIIAKKLNETFSGEDNYIEQKITSETPGLIDKAVSSFKTYLAEELINEDRSVFKEKRSGISRGETNIRGTVMKDRINISAKTINKQPMSGTIEIFMYRIYGGVEYPEITNNQKIYGYLLIDYEGTEREIKFISKSVSPSGTINVENLESIIGRAVKRINYTNAAKLLTYKVFPVKQEIEKELLDRVRHENKVTIIEKKYDIPIDIAISRLKRSKNEFVYKESNSSFSANINEKITFKPYYDNYDCYGTLKLSVFAELNNKSLLIYNFDYNRFIDNFTGNVICCDEQLQKKLNEKIGYVENLLRRD